MTTRAAACVFSAVACAILSACSSGSTSVLAPSSPSEVRCNVSVASTSSRIGAGGGSGTLTITTSRECRWTIAGGADWLAFSSATTGQGPGQVPYAVQPNRSTEPRQLELTIGDEHITIAQDAATCAWKLSPETVTVAAEGGEVRAAVSTADYCSWKVTAALSWIGLTSAASGTGSSEISLRVAANAGGERTGNVQVESAALTITQRAAVLVPPPSTQPQPCTYEVGPLRFDNVAASATDAYVDIKSGSGCAWTAVSQASWITAAPSTGSGNGRVRLTVAANNADKRSGTASVAGQTITVSQIAAPCTYTVKPDSFHFSSSDHTAEITVTTKAWCAVRATTPASWVHIGTFAQTGSGKIPLSIDKNGSTSKRTTTVSVSGDDNFSDAVPIDQDGK